MADRDLNEIDVGRMLGRAQGYGPGIGDGRWVIETRHRGEPWAIIVEPDTATEVACPAPGCVTAPLGDLAVAPAQLSLDAPGFSNGRTAG